MIERPQHLREKDQFSSRFGLRDVPREAELGLAVPGEKDQPTNWQMAQNPPSPRGS